jgi:hypothetical protein
MFDFASQHYGEKSYRRRDQVIRGTMKGPKTSFMARLSQTEDRLDPPFYLLRHQAGRLIASMPPLGTRVEPVKGRFRPKTDEELDADYAILSVSSDGKVSLNEHRKGWDIPQRCRRVRAEHIVYNPVRINIGSVGVAPEELDGSYASPDYIVFRSKIFELILLAHLLRTPFYRMCIDVITTGSIRDRLYFSDLQRIHVPDVPESAQAQVCAHESRIEDELRELLATISTERRAAADRLHGLIKAAAAGSPGSAGTEERFRALADQWRRETRLQSSVSKKIRHPAYLKLMEMGEEVVPLILGELAKEPDHWFAALRTVTGETPHPPEKTAMAGLAAAWIEWGRKKRPCRKDG